MKSPQINLVCAIFALSFFCANTAGRQKPLAGRVFAYDPMVHMATMMNLTDVDSEEIIILDTGRAGKDRFVKVDVYAYDRRPLTNNVLEGQLEVRLHGNRSEKCDEKK